jgi:hypothetical protein
MSDPLPFEKKMNMSPDENYEIGVRTRREVPSRGWGVIKHLNGTSRLPHSEVVDVFGYETYSDRAARLARVKAAVLNETEGEYDLPSGGDIPDAETSFTAAEVSLVDVSAELTLRGAYEVVQDRKQPQE